MGFASACALVPGASAADPSSPAVEQRRQSPAEAGAESEYNRGVRAAWAQADVTITASRF